MSIYTKVYLQNAGQQHALSVWSSLNQYGQEKADAGNGEGNSAHLLLVERKERTLFSLVYIRLKVTVNRMQTVESTLATVCNLSKYLTNKTSVSMSFFANKNLS